MWVKRAEWEDRFNPFTLKFESFELVAAPKMDRHKWVKNTEVRERMQFEKFNEVIRVGK